MLLNFNEDEEKENSKEKNRTIDFPFKTKDTSKRYNNAQNSFKEDSIIFVENVSIEMLAINEENKKKEELKISLEHLYDGFLEQYNKKEYLELITEIESKEELFYKNSIESFKIYILKIKAIIKLMINDFYKAIIKENNSNQNIVKEYTNRIMNEFKNLNKIINKNSKYENEIITQVYCRFLIFLILFELRKENRAKSLAYITLGLNMMKIFFIKDQVATEIKTYYNYMKLNLLLINHLINDNNFIGSLYHINFGFNLLDKIFRFINLWKLPKKYYQKAIDYASFNYIYSGICLEHNSINLRLAMDCFRQANYFLEKNNLISNYSPFSSIFKNRNNRLKYENIFYLVSNATIKLIKKEFVKIKKEQESMMLKTKEEREKEEKINQNISEKKEKLRLISNGLCVNYKKFFPIQEKIYKNILTPKVTINIEKTDKELSEFVYNKKISNNTISINVSNDTKLNLCRLEIYNDLVTDKYREFITKNKQLKFNDPSKIRDNLKKIRTYLNLNDIDLTKNNNKYIIDNNIKRKKLKSRNLTFNNLKENKILSKTITIKEDNSIKNHKINYDNKSFNNKNKIINVKNYYYKNNDKMNLIKNNNIESNSLNNFRNKNKLKIFNIKTYNNNSKIKLTKNRNIIDRSDRNNYDKNYKNKKFHSYDFKLENNFDRKYLDKYLTTKKYQAKYFDYEKLMKKEYKFQKYFLKMKNFHSNLYFDDYQKELNNNDINERYYNSKESAYKKFLVINNKVNNEVFGNKADLQKIINEHKKKITNITKGFKLLGKSAVDDEKMKNCMNKVIQKYIIENRAKKLGKFNNYVDNEEIKKKNEKQILKLNNTIRNINCEFNRKKNQYKNPS